MASLSAGAAPGHAWAQIHAGSTSSRLDEHGLALHGLGLAFTAKAATVRIEIVSAVESLHETGAKARRRRSAAPEDGLDGLRVQERLAPPPRGQPPSGATGWGAPRPGMGITGGGGTAPSWRSRSWRAM